MAVHSNAKTCFHCFNEGFDVDGCCLRCVCQAVLGSDMGIVVGCP